MDTLSRVNDPPAGGFESLLDTATRLSAQFAAQAERIDHEHHFPFEEFAQLARHGLLAAPLAPGHGGAGLAFHHLTITPLLELLAIIGRGNLSVGRVFEGHVNALQLLQLYATPAQMKRYADDVLDGKVFAVWNTEAADGVTLQPLEDGRIQLQGCKIFASGAGYVTRAFVNGTLPDGRWQMCIVALDEVDVDIDRSWWQPSGMRASASYRVDFSGITLAADALIGEPGDYQREPWFTGGALRFAAVQVGGIEALCEITCRHLLERGRGNDPYQRARVGEMALALHSVRHWLSGAASALADVDSQPGQLVHYARMCRSAIEHSATDVIQLAQRCVGAQGFLRPHPLERVSRDLTMYLRQPGPDAVLAAVGDYLLAQYSEDENEHAH